MSRPAGHDVKPPAGEAPAALPGEAGIPDVARSARTSPSAKGLFAVALLVLSLLAGAVIAIERLTSTRKPAEDAVSKRAGDRPATASGEPRRLDFSAPPVSAAASSNVAGTTIPALSNGDADDAEPIGVHRTGQAAAAPAAHRTVLPEDAPVVLVAGRPGPGSITARVESRPAGQEASAAAGGNVSDPLAETRRNLTAYEQQLQALLDAMTRPPTAATSPPLRTASAKSLAALAAPSGAPEAGSLFGGQLQKSATPQVVARLLGNRSLVLPMGTAFTCALQTKVVSATSGFLSCLVQRNLFGADGRVLLVERGSQVDGEYRVASIKPGTVRIPVLWTRIRTSHGVTVDIDSPGTGALGESGIDGYVDNRWGERIGAAMLLSLIDDSVQLALQHESSSAQGNAVVLPSTTTNTSKLADKVLDSTINIPPLIYRNQGGIVGVYVARDVDFSSVYVLRPSVAADEP